MNNLNSNDVEMLLTKYENETRQQYANTKRRGQLEAIVEIRKRLRELVSAQR